MTKLRGWVVGQKVFVWKAFSPGYMLPCREKEMWSISMLSLLRCRLRRPLAFLSQFGVRESGELGGSITSLEQCSRVRGSSPLNPAPLMGVNFTMFPHWPDMKEKLKSTNGLERNKTKTVK